MIIMRWTYRRAAQKEGYMRVLEVPRGTRVRVHDVSRQGSLATVRPVLAGVGAALGT